MTYSTGRPGGARRDLVGMAGEVSVPEAGMVVLLLDNFFFLGSIVARNLEGFCSKRRSIRE